MRGFIYSLLIFLMLTPAMACAMPVCDDGAMPMKMTHDEMGNHIKAKHKVKLITDCMGVDLQSVDSVHVAKPDFKAWVTNGFTISGLPLLQIADVRTKSIRAPPPDLPDAPDTSPSPILTTGRIRL